MDLSVTNAWIAVGAVSLAVIAVGVIAALVFIVRAVRAVSDSAARASAAIEQVSRDVSPLAAQTSAFLGDVHDLVHQLRHTDEVTTAAVGRIADRWRRISAVAKVGLWPAITAARGAAAVVQWIAGRESTRRDTVVDNAAEAQFVYEGGEQVRSGAGR